MQIELDGRVLEVPDEYVDRLAEDLWAKLEDLYTNKVDDAFKAGAMALVRGLLVKQEMVVRMRYGKEAAKAMRPPGREDPTLWVARKFLPVVRESLNHATITCQTRGDTITDFAVQLPDIGETGRQMDFAGGVGVRENNSLKVS